MDFETTYERSYADRESDADYRCPHCGEMNGGEVCRECKTKREDEAGRIEDALIAAKQLATEAFDARWDEDTTKTRARLSKDLRTEMDHAFFLATGERL